MQSGLLSPADLVDLGLGSLLERFWDGNLRTNAITVSDLILSDLPAFATESLSFDIVFYEEDFTEVVFDIDEATSIENFSHFPRGLRFQTWMHLLAKIFPQHITIDMLHLNPKYGAGGLQELPCKNRIPGFLMLILSELWRQ